MRSVTGFERIGESHIYRREVEGKIETVYFENGPPISDQKDVPAVRTKWTKKETIKLALAATVVIATAILGFIQIESDVKKLQHAPLVVTPTVSP